MFGVVLFFTPDLCGRKISLTFTAVLSAIASAVILFVPNTAAKSAGFFVIGFAHNKNSVSFTYCWELFPVKHQDIAITALGFYDTGNIAFSCAFVLLTGLPMQTYMIINFTLGVAGLILFILLVPESPKFLLMNDPSSSRGI